MKKISEHKLNRNAALGVAALIGIGFGLANAWWRPVDFTLDLELLLSALGGATVTIFAHELLHALPAWALGLKPIFGFKPPLVFMTFTEKIKLTGDSGQETARKIYCPLCAVRCLL